MENIKVFYCGETGGGSFHYKPLDIVICLTFLHSGHNWYHEKQKSRVQLQVSDYSSFNFPEELTEVDNEFHLIVNSDTPGKDGDMDYKVTYQILIDDQARTISSKAIKIAKYEELYLPSGDLEGVEISL